MGAGRRFGRGGGCGGGGGRNQRMLKHHIDSCKKKCSTVDDIVQHLRERHPNYRRMELKTLTRLVSFIQKESLPSREPHRPINRKRGGGEDEDGKSSPAVLRKRTKWSGDDEEEGDFIRLSATSDSDEDPDSDSESKSVPESKSNLQSSSTSEDAVYGEKVEPEFDLMRSMLREKYMSSASKEKSVEVEEGESERVVKTLGTERRREGENVRNLSHKTVTGEEQDREGGPRFKDLGGMNGVLEELETEVFLPFYHPEVPKRLGVNPISGILLHGPPGCGKTKLACAIANEAGVPFYKISATEVVSGVSGASEENIRELFTKAYRTAPSIVFIDEIDAIGSKRENLQREMEKRIVTQLMTCMDSSSSSDQSLGRILVIGATNRPDALDPALRRPGRFDREINLGIPDENARVEILSVLTRKCTLEGSINLLQIARSTSGFVGADLNAVVNKAGSIAMKRIFLQRKLELSTRDEWLKMPWSDEDIKKLAITMTDFEKAIKLVQPSLLREGFSTIPDITWEDVGGLDDIRREFEFHVIKRIKYPEVYQKFGVNLETGILLYGPPGCGKTLIAKAVANEAGANFIHVKGPEVLNKYVGESELAVRTIFSRARSCSPCVLFFDEIDALTTKRGKEGGWVVERLVNQLLAEFGSDHQPGVFIIGATNRPEVMDPALLRPGRFGKILYVSLPSSEDRGSILKTLARGKPVDPNIDLSAIGRMEACEKLSGADLRKLMEDAAMTALEEEMEEETMSRSCEEPCFINANHFEQALSKISPSVSDKQLQYYKIWSENFRKT